MATIAEQLTSLANTKTAIKDAIVAKGVQVADDTPFSGYADKIGEISGGGEPVEKTKFGVSVDNFLGDVDADGKYHTSQGMATINLSGVKIAPTNSFYYKFYDMKKLVVIANDVTALGDYAFAYAFSVMTSNNTSTISLSFDGLENVTAKNAFYYACDKRPSYYNKPLFSFKKLKTVTGNNAFDNFATYCECDIGEVFPSLEEISGNSTFNTVFRYFSQVPQNLTKVKKITGSTSQYSSTFGSISYANTVWNFPSATEFKGYIWNANASYPGEIHFAAANQAAIEACDGYANKWGFAGATIYFDL